MLWQYTNTKVPESDKELTEILLQNRSISDPELFFSPPHPSEFSVEAVGIAPEQMAAAVRRIKQAIRNQEKVLIFGDYDADGISATAILWQAIKAAGLIAVPFIPRRDVHGYGITKKALDEVIAAGAPSLIVTVDNGIVAHSATAYALEKGIDVVISDHHQPEKTAQGSDHLPPALATVHTTKLCGSTVSWMLARELSEEAALDNLDLAALATIADQVPLHGANRSFAVHGLEALRKTRKVGLKALSELANIDLAELSSSSVGYSLAPRINAMGRLAHGLDALRLLCTGSWQTARKLARLLSETNSSRQDLTHDQLQIALEQIKLQQEESVLFVHSDQFHEGVIGLIAGRLVEQFSKPALVVSLGGEVAKGSARSVAGVDIVQVLRAVREDLLEVGGHPMAAGFGISLEKVEVVKERLFTLTRSSIEKSLLVPKLVVECRLPLSQVRISGCEAVQKFDPFGAGNPEPLFAFENLKLIDLQTLGKHHQHLKLLLGDPESEDHHCQAVFWNQAQLQTRLRLGKSISFVARLECNEWKGRKKPQLVLKDIKFEQA